MLAASLSATLFLFAQSEWEGTTAMGRYGEFPATGYYGASNSFPRNTLVKVENIENGTSVEVMIVDRLDDPGLFLLLSREAAEEIGIQDNRVVRTRIVLADNSSRLSVESADRPYSSDPDLNPNAEDDLAFLDRYLGAEEKAPAVEPEAPPMAEPLVIAAADAEAPEVIAEPAPEVSEDVEPVLLTDSSAGLESALPEEEGSLDEPVITDPAVIADIVVAPAAEPVPAEPEITGPYTENLVQSDPADDSLSVVPDAPFVMDKASATRVADNMYNPKAVEEGDNFAAADLPAVPAQKERDRVIAELFPLPEPPYDGEDEVAFAAAAPALQEAPAAPLEKTEEEDSPAIAVVPEEKTPPVVPEGDVEISLVPAEDRPPVAPVKPAEPEVKEAPEAAAAVDSSSAPAVLFGDLDPASDYLQLAVFSSAGSARSTAERFSSTYPVLVLNQGNAYYKVLVGPLSPDESGALLLNFKAQGFRDAFIRKGF